MKLTYIYFFTSLLLSSTMNAGCCGDPFYITQSMMPDTLAEGVYCLAESVEGNISIFNTHNVILDLSGRSISAGSPNIHIAGCSNIIIRNGTIKNANLGININVSTNISLENLDFVGSDTGVSITSSSLLRINNCSFKDHTSQAMVIQNSFLGEITNILCEKNNGMTGIWLTEGNSNITFRDVKIVKNNPTIFSFSSGFRVENSHDCDFINCSVNDNEAIADFGYAGFFFNACFNINLYNCIASFNTVNSGVAAGFISNSDQITFDSCKVQTNIGLNAVGLWILGSKNPVIKNCIISNNTAANQSTGISYAGNTGIVRNNIITNNIGTGNSFGIKNDSSTLNSIWSNQAQGHANNLSGTMPKVTYDATNGNFLIYGTLTPTTPTPYDNIDVQIIKN